MKPTIANSLLVILALTSPVQASSVLHTSFEDLPASAFTELQTDAGQWRTVNGEAEITRDAKEGRHCLHLMGGKETVVELTLPAAMPLFQMSFWADRWTRHSPFSFRVLAWDAESWREVHNGDKIIKGLDQAFFCVLDKYLHILLAFRRFDHIPVF